jgi:drug/metabolite transporter (DMT)-like permease
VRCINAVFNDHYLYILYDRRHHADENGRRLSAPHTSDGFALSMGWKTFAGFCFYIISFLLWQRLIVKYDLSIMVPIVNGVVQLVILGLGTIVFREKISTVTLIGAFVVIAGIVIMAFGTQSR